MPVPGNGSTQRCILLRAISVLRISVLHSLPIGHSDILPPYANKRFKTVLQRVESWPKEAQEEALQSLQVIEEDFVSDAKLAGDLVRADEEIRRAKGTPQGEVFERYGL